MLLKKAKEVLYIEAQAVKDLAKKINADFLKAIDLIAKCKGRVIVTGMGKTGIISHKIASTLSSTGTPSIWMHSAEAVHGDLGQVTKDDVVIIVSNSGETEETKRLIPLVKKIGSKIDSSKSQSILVYCDLAAALVIGLASLLLRLQHFPLPLIFIFGFVSAVLQAFIDPTLNKAVSEVVEAAIRIGAHVIWMQDGIVHNEAADRARKAGLKVVMDKCMLREHHARR